MRAARGNQLAGYPDATPWAEQDDELRAGQKHSMNSKAAERNALAAESHVALDAQAEQHARNRLSELKWLPAS
jgi:hypothetical protein